MIEEENLLDHATKMGALILERCQEMQTRYPQMGDVRGRGMMVGIEIITDQETRNHDQDLRDELIQVAFKHGLLTLPCGESVLRFIPALNTPQEIIEEGLQKFETALAEVTQQAIPA